MPSSKGSVLAGVFVLAVLLGPGTDSTLTQRLPGYGGVLPIPFAADEGTAVMSSVEILGPKHTEGRIERGRVLYANDHAPKSSDAPPVRTARAKQRPPCTTSLVQSRSSAAPNS